MSGVKKAVVIRKRNLQRIGIKGKRIHFKVISGGKKKPEPRPPRRLR